ncbi:MAG: patatin-like phospholipase family protein [Blastocatellia bacterium]
MHNLHPRRVGLALSGGGVRGLAHIGVIKALEDLGLQPVVVAGTSAGSLVGAGLAAGMNWRELAAMARSVFWPSLFNGRRLEAFCTRHLPATFGDLCLPFAAVATEIRSRRVVAITEGPLASAISASCAVRVVRRAVVRDGRRLKDGGYVCVMPSVVARELGAEFVIASDVWELSGLLRGAGCHPLHPLFPAHYRAAVRGTDLLVQPEIPLACHAPTKSAIDRLIAAGERATHRALSRL